MRCPSCGVNNDDNARHCKACGRPLPTRTGSGGGGANNQNNVMKGIIIAVIVLCVVIIGIAAFFITRLLANQNDKNDTNEAATTTASETITTTAKETTAQPTTATPTTAVQPTTEPAINAPKVIGMRTGDAYAQLNNVGLNYQTSFDYSDTIPKDYVISQTPSPDTKLKKGDVVNICISLGPKPAEPTTPEPTTQKVTTTGDYILPTSNTAKLSKSDIDWMDSTTMTLALNEIYARHHRKFKTQWIADYFNTKSWYSGTRDPEDIPNSEFNTYEGYNINLINAVMKEKGYR